MRVLVLWADDSSANLGVRALAQGARELARMAWGSDVDVVLQDFRGSESGVAITPRALLEATVSRRGPLAEFVQGFDVVLDTGAGDSFADIYGAKRMAALVGMQRLSRALSVPHLLAPQTIGPFDRGWARAAARRSIARYVDVVFARDSLSAAYARSLGAGDVRDSTDVVFALSKKESVDTDFDVLFNVSGLLWESSAHVDSRGYQAVVRTTLDRLLADGRRVTLLPHVLDSEYADNDVPTSERLADEYSGRVDLVVPETLDDARGLIARSRVVVASRMHAALNAISQSIPAVPLAYSRKFAPLLQDLGIDWAIDLRDVAPDEVRGRVLQRLDSFDRGAHDDVFRALDARVRPLLGETAATMRARVEGMTDG